METTIVDLHIHSPRRPHPMDPKVELEWKRATADHSGTCQPCGGSTNRIVAFRPKGNTRYDAMFLCDDCLEMLGKLSQISRRPADS